MYKLSPTKTRLIPKEGSVMAGNGISKTIEELVCIITAELLNGHPGSLIPPKISLVVIWW
jgi:hypothetical protein